VKLATQLQLVPKLKKLGTIPPLSICLTGVVLK